MIDRSPVGCDPRRTATRKQRHEILTRSRGRCEVLIDPYERPLPPGVHGMRCEKPLKGRWVAGHFPVLWSSGGRTILENLRGECVECTAIVKVAENAIAKKVTRMKKHHETGRGKQRKGRPLKSRPFSKGVKRKIPCRPFQSRPIQSPDKRGS